MWVDRKWQGTYVLLVDFNPIHAGLAVYAQDVCEALAEGGLLGSHWHSPHFGERLVPFCGLGQKNHYIQG